MRGVPVLATQAEVAPQDRLVTLPQWIPDLTLGWEVIQWASTYLKHPNGPRAGQRWEFVESQVLFLLHWYAVNSDGSWVYHHGVRRLSKGSGKSPFAALIALAELCAPVRLKDFDPRLPGGCKGRHVDMPWVQIAATAESQTKNTMRMVRAFAPKGSRIAQEFHLDPGKTVYYKAPEGVLEVITSSASAAEGAEASCVIQDETEWFLPGNGGPELAATIEDNLAKALDVATPMLTTAGWSTMGNLKPGDQVFGPDGLPTRVTAASGVFSGHDCYRVTLSDGRSVVADGGHLWTVLGQRRSERIRTTVELAEALTGASRNGRIKRQYGIDVPGALITDDALLPVDPYVLGFWLGDGRSRDGSLTIGDSDYEEVTSLIRNAGYVTTDHARYPGKNAHTVTVRLAFPVVRVPGTAHGDTNSLTHHLRPLGVLGNKHIPEAYRLAGAEQRLALLRGLMDSDGTVTTTQEDRYAYCAFTSTLSVLARDVLFLVRSLGWKAKIKQGRAKLNGKDCGPCYKVTWCAHADRSPFRLTRKTSRLKNAPDRAVRSRTLKIVSVEPVPSRPTRCITVDHPRSMYLAGTGLVPTHNSGNRSIETSNAWKPGIGSVAEATYDSWLAQEEGHTRAKSKILYDARIAPPDTDMADEASLRSALEFTYGDCWWQKIEPIMARIWDPRSSPDDSKRKYLNWPTVAADAWTTPQEWAQLSDSTVVVADGDEIVMFFDGSLSNDATALVGCHVETGHVFCIDVWEPAEMPEGTRWHVPTDQVDAAVAHAFDRWTVMAFFADVKEWESFTKVEWPKLYGDQLEIMSVPGGRDPQQIAWDMRSHVHDFTMAAELTLTEIQARGFTHDGDSRVARHIANARNHPNRSGVSISKETRSSAKKIDAAVCVIGARMVRRLYLASAEANKPKRVRTGVVRGFS